MEGRLELFGVACWHAPAGAQTLPDSLPGYLVAYLAYRGDWVGRESLAGLFQAAPEAARRVPAAVAVAGDARAIAGIAAVAGLSTWACAEALDQLQAAGLLHEYRFAHDLVRQSVHDSTPPALRRVLHASVARELAGALRP